MKRILFLMPCLILGLATIGQNTVQDPGFEDWDGTVGVTPTTLSPLFQWTEVNGSPDHHHQLNPVGSNLTSLEPCPLGNGQNQCGEPVEGQAVLGCYKANEDVGTKEWAATQLTEPMTPGICYNVSFWIQNKKDNPSFIMETNQWGMFFSNDPTPAFDPNTLDFNTVANQFVTSQQVVDDTIWHHLEWTYVPDQAYEYIYLGYMGNVADATENAWSMATTVGFYVWIDLVVVEPVFFPFLTAGPDIVACAGEEFTIYADSNLPITWSTGASGDSLHHTEMVAGTYTYTATMGAGQQCEFSQDIEVEVLDCNCPAPITADVSVTDATNCPDVLPCDGQAIMTASSGVAPFVFDWGDPAMTNAPGVNGLCPGTYTLTLTDADGCIATTDYTIGGVDAVQVDFVVTNESCQGAADGAIDMTVSQGAGGYTYSWTGGATDEDLTGLTTGWYYVDVLDGSGCTFLDSVFVDVNASQVIEVDVPGEYCIDAAPFILDASLSNGAWNGYGIIDAVTGMFDPSVSGAGNITVQFTENDLCNTVYNVNVVVRQLPLVAFSSNPTLGCADLDVEFNLAGPPTAGDYLWDLGDGTTTDSVPPFNHIYTDEGPYDVSLTLTDAFGCTNSGTVPSAVQVIAQPNANFTFSPDVLTDFNNVMTFTDASTGPITLYDWNFGNGQTSDEPSAEVTYTEPGSYLVSLYVESGEGCSDEVTYSINYSGDVILYVPNSFTPDGDGLNDYFQVVTTSNLSLYTLQIYDRWGTIVFESDDINEPWNGGVYSEFRAIEDPLYFAMDNLYNYVITYNARSGGGSLEKISGTIFIQR